MKVLSFYVFILLSFSALAEFSTSKSHQINIDLVSHDIPQGSEAEFEKDVLKKLSRRRFTANRDVPSVATVEYRYSISDQFIAIVEFQIVIDETNEIFRGRVSCRASNLFTWEYPVIENKCSRLMAKTISKTVKDELRKERQMIDNP